MPSAPRHARALLAGIVDKFLVEAVSLGYSVDEVVEQIKKRLT